MKNILLLSIILLCGIVKGQNIAAARGTAVGSTVAVTGVVINGPEMGTIRYLQDNTAGIAAFSTTLSSLNRGDSVRITGVLTEFKNLLEISTSTANPAPISFTALGSGITQTPSVITVPQFNESVEGRLIKFTGCSFSASGTFSSGVNYTVNTGAGSFVARVTSSVSNLFGSSIPTGTVDIVGIGSQFCSSPATGCTTGYQLALRDVNDITPSSIGINEYSNTRIRLFVFPNPANDKLSFNLNASESVRAVVVADVTGKVLIRSLDNSRSLDITGLTDGMYFIMVNTEAKQYQSSFIISR